MEVDMIYQPPFVVCRSVYQLLELHIQQACGEAVVGSFVEIYIEVTCHYLGSGSVKKWDNFCGKFQEVAVFTESVDIDDDNF